jgi:glycosyltransferase involved in cell wall biosynthesis
MRIAVLWTGLSGYLNSCLKELAGRKGVDLFVSSQPPEAQAPFDDDQFAWIQNHLVMRSAADFDPLAARLRAFNPEILLFCGWHVPAYRRMAETMARKCWRVMCMDNCWSGTLRQRLATFISPWYVRPLADAVWLPGERQAVFARKLGFEQCTILRGLYSCDQPAFETVHLSRVAEGRAVPRSFLFVGRFVSCKGVDQLVKAYESYRAASTDPWPLVCCGAGPLVTRLQGIPGIRVDGFVQPDELRTRLASAGCLVLPSTFEPWAVVVHEATSAGLLVLASEKVGATVHLVQNNYNGYIFDSQDAQGLAKLMSHVSSLREEQLDAMSRASHLLSKQFSPKRWADTLLDAFQASPLREACSNLNGQGRTR